MIRTRRLAALEARIMSGDADLDVQVPPSGRRSPAAGAESSSATTTECSSSQGVDDQAEGEEEDDGVDADKSRAVGILFLAHDGITNPDLWERWRLSDPAYADRIRFFAFRNLKVAHESAFCVYHDLRLRLRTQWCSASIVKATVESLKRVLILDPEVQMVYLVSGFDIPIQPPRALFTTRHVVTEGVPRTVVPFRTVLGFTHEDEALKSAEGWAKKGTDDDVRSRVVCHVQWCGLSRAHCEKLVAFKDLERLLTLGNRLSCQSCPDEWLLGTILALQGITRDSPDVLDWTITDQYRQRGKDQSPILWKDLDTTKARVFWAPPNCFRTFTLGAVLDKVSRQEGNLFFRKVGPLTPEETDRVLAPILQSPSLPASVSGGESAATDWADTSSLPRWEPASDDGEPPSSGAASSSSSYAEPDVDDDDDEEDEKEEEELRSVEASFSSASSVTTAASPVSGSSASCATDASASASTREKEEEDEKGGDAAAAPSVPSTPHLQRQPRHSGRLSSRAEATHKRLAAEAALSEESGEEEEEEDGEHVIPAARNLRMVGPPGRCANGQC